METRLQLDILPQPDDTTCGATCLHAIYRYYQNELPLKDVVGAVERIEGGGTLGVLLARHALEHDYQVTLYTYNLRVFDPTWFVPPGKDLVDRLWRQMKEKKDRKLQVASRAYIEFIKRGGEIRFADLTAGLIRRYLTQSVPILTGLSATYLYRSAREYGPTNEYDDVRGTSTGHFVVLCGYDSKARNVLVADPYIANPVASQYYEVKVSRLICSILLGVLTYDANLLIIRPKETR